MDTIAVHARQDQPAALCPFGYHRDGPPFATRSLSGLSQLSVWWPKLGILPERIAPGHPEQNGRHERMHRTLKQETTRPPKLNRALQQVAFDCFREIYNHERPHAALGDDVPADHYVPNPRGPIVTPEPSYPEGTETRKVHHQGAISFRNGIIYLVKALAGETVPCFAPSKPNLHRFTLLRVKQV
jgi:hypothetical protein